MENQLNQIDIKLNELERQIKRVYLPTKEPTNEYVEGANIPYMNWIFINLLIDRGRLPTPTDFFTEYLSVYWDTPIVEDLMAKGYKSQLRGRLFRTYPSLLRDIHFGMSLQQLGFGEVVYNSKLDGKLGIDLLIIHGGVKFALHLYVGTQNSKQHREHKLKENYDVDCSIELPLQLDSAETIGDIKVYSYSYFIELLMKMNKYLAKEIKNK